MKAGCLGCCAFHPSPENNVMNVEGKMDKQTTSLFGKYVKLKPADCLTCKRATLGGEERELTHFSCNCCNLALCFSEH